jgi:futalosine hydrolase
VILLAYAIDQEIAFWQPRADVDTLRMGVGPVEAASSVARALATRTYDLVVNAGIAGAHEGVAAVGDGVIVADEFLELTLESGEAIVLPDGQEMVYRASSDPALCAQLAERGFPLLHGNTVSIITATDATASRLARLDAQVESMEGFAVLRAAQLAGVPAIELRGISNRVGDRDLSQWNFAAGVAGLRAILEVFFSMLDATPMKAR